jgi:multidrug efflux pump
VTGFNDGSYTLDVTFELGTDVNTAQALVQNRVATAWAALNPASAVLSSPARIRRPGEPRPAGRHVALAGS